MTYEEALPPCFDATRFGDRLKAARIREGYRSVEDLAASLSRNGIHISTRQLRRYEKGTHSPNSALLAALIVALPSDRAAFYFDSITRQPDDTHASLITGLGWLL